MYTFLVVALRHPISSSPLHLFTSSPLHSLHLLTSSRLHSLPLFTSSFSPFSSPLHLFILFPSSPLHSLHSLHLFTSSFSLPSSPLHLFFLRSSPPAWCNSGALQSLSNDLDIVIEFRCVVTVSTPAVWLARKNIKRLTPRPCINVEYSHRVVYIEECTTSVFH